MDGNNMNQVNDYTYEADASTYEAPATGGSNALAIVSLICGIVSIVCCAGIGPLTGIAAIICGVIGKKNCPNANMAKWGMILGIIGLVLTVIVYIVSFALGFLGGMMEYM